MTFRVDTIERADGTRGTRDIVGHPGAVAILAIDADDRILLVRQYRVAVGEALLEIPAGTLDVAEDGTVEDPDEAARRELEEETGARAGTWQKVATFFTAPGFASELMHLYLATDLRAADGERLQPDEDEALELERIPWREALAAAERGEYRDAKTLVGLLWLARLRDA
ncbi:MAG TPA: NUDIX hydrolase [Candidatus Limnocylindrales bacterium]